MYKIKLISLTNSRKSNINHPFFIKINHQPIHLKKTENIEIKYKNFIVLLLVFNTNNINNTNSHKKETKNLFINKNEIINYFFFLF